MGDATTWADEADALRAIAAAGEDFGRARRMLECLLDANAALSAALRHVRSARDGALDCVNEAQSSRYEPDDYALLLGAQRNHVDGAMAAIARLAEHLDDATATHEDT